MTRLVVLFLAVVFAIVPVFSAVAAENFPAPAAAAKAQTGPSPAEAQQRLYYGYVPPPPILHAWPGGYRVVIHQMMNTLAEHLLGHF